MLPFILACLVSYIPYVLLYLWLRKRINKNELSQKLCNHTLLQGFLSILFVLPVSAACHILLNVLKIREINPLLFQFLYTVVVLALAEEAVKYWTFRKVIRKNDYPYSWVDLTVLMSIVGIGFGFLEAVTYSIGSNIPTVLIRGFTLPHAGYGYLIGYYYGKGLKKNKPGLKWVGFLLSWFMHGLYDFSLSTEFLEINENLVFVPFILVAIDVILVFMLIAFVRKSKKKEDYTETLIEQKAEMPKAEEA